MKFCEFEFDPNKTTFRNGIWTDLRFNNIVLLFIIVLCCFMSYDICIDRVLLRRQENDWGSSQTRTTTENHAFQIFIFSSKKCKSDAKFIFLQIANFVLTIFVRFEFCTKMSFSNFLEGDISMTNSKRKRVVKTKFTRFQKMEFASNLHFCDKKLNCCMKK